MPRPRCCRHIAGAPACKVFKPAGRPTATLEEVALSLEEYEAIRLADFEALYQEEAAQRMGVSRQTFGRTIARARAKVARALVLGGVLRIEVSEAEAAALTAPLPALARDQRAFSCQSCGHAWQEPFGTGRPKACPACGAGAFHREGCAGTGSPCGHTSTHP
ncbi:MAG: DUF134 domain-containing protein [Humidesulfovibrio sp.]|nr:DUF134 domain-containing protein [Humidesulfovibrio sp.]